jgi:RNA polymerase sigma-70 factor (ECF subfamily)
MVNTALMYLRKYRKMKFTDKEQSELENSLTVKEDIHEKMNADAIIELVQTLPRGYQTVFNLYAIEGYAHKEIAEQLGISEGTSRSQYLRAKAAMRVLLEKMMDVK